MKLTIETGNMYEVNQLLDIFKTLKMDNIRVVLDNTNKSLSAPTDLLKEIHRPLKKRLDIDALKKAKNYKGVNRKRFDELVREINIVEPIEVLLSQLSR
jgi:hypothetical protein